MTEENPSDRSPSPKAGPNLGLVRTDLANERTLLAYGRAALMVAGTGVSLIEFFNVSPIFRFLGWALVVVGIAVGLIGISRFARLHRSLHKPHS